MKVYYKNVGSFLRKRMKEKKLSAKYLSLKYQIPLSTLNDFFNGKAYKGYMEILEKLSGPLDITTLEISFFEEETSYVQETSTPTSLQNHVIKESTLSSNKALFDPDILLPENKKQFDKLVKKNNKDLLRRENALKRLYKNK